MYQKNVRLTSKYQATVPKEVRDALNLKAHDQITYEILNDKTVIIRRARPLDTEYLKALEYTLSEWDSKEDDEAYGNL